MCLRVTVLSAVRTARPDSRHPLRGMIDLVPVHQLERFCSRSEDLRNRGYFRRDPLAGQVHRFSLQNGPSNVAIRQHPAKNPIGGVQSTSAPVPALSR